ncbi:MAG: hypothetical protein ABFR62_12025 [Bacteroidota bacterium]
MTEEINKENAKPAQNTPEKAEKDHKLKTLVWMFGVLLIAAIAYIIYAYSDHKEVQEFLTQEKLEVEGELAKMEHQYEGLKLDNDTLNTKLVAQQERISGLRDSVSQMKASVSLLRKYKRLIKTMKEEKRQLFLLADSLDRMNQVLVAQRDSAEFKLQEQTIMSEKLADQNLILAQEVEKGAIIDVINLRAEGVKLSSTGKVSSTSRARRTDKVRVCMTLGRNKLTKIGEKTIYIRVATPNDLLLGTSTGGDKSFTVDGEKMNYSAKSNIYYEQEALDVCVFADGLEDEFVKGVYLVAVYVDGSFIGETQMNLK